MAPEIIRKLGRYVVESAYKNEKVRNHVHRIQKDAGYLMLQDLGDHLIAFDYFEYIGQELYRNGEYQRALMISTLNYLRDSGRLNQGGTMIEVGANIGTHTIYASLEHDFDRIICMEPDPRNYRLLEINTAINRTRGRVKLLQAAAGDRDGKLLLSQNAWNHGMSRIIDNDESAANSIEVEVRALDEVLQTEKVRADDIRLIWIDVEGFELNVMKGMVQTLTARPSICMEFSPSPLSPIEGSPQAELLDLLFSTYKEVYRFQSGRFQATDRMTLLKSEVRTDLLLIDS